ncbi:tellurite resistance/C4-dicarboxylate transporter family protein [Streptomyces luomodiensis]|uniref:Tellurite resistance/C4-dicarboxylate transporter family protein n=1 Tax=Streptomyces luomodiensis TaxID=3026192 RepID=A0ABY9UTU8_9ACTN|nr:tellurite resistance/C4-dicarboxylate transporter family protein [Streptomyces sp. SCA4-21]WNE95975.1 tellurite resistance/C4-dicarboxylate transporter family protein [Streptomyces sp. SCA4-21]
MPSVTARNLPPSAFAPVMATGIVSQALAADGARRLSDALLAVAVVVYGGLLAGLVWRVARYPGEVAADLRDPGRLFGFFTFVAGSDVLAVRLASGPWRAAAVALPAMAVPVCAVLLGCVARLAYRLGAGGMVRRADGTWFLCVVGLQSTVLAVAALAPGRARPAEAFGWAAGVLLYAAVATVVAGRLTRFGIRPRELAPPYWITMGACAISLLAGARLAHQGLGTPHPGPVLRVVLLALWGWATCLLPPLLAAGVWRHLVHRVPLGYEPAFWTIVFPTGMYAVSTAALGETEGIRRLVALGHVAAWVALGMWALVAAGLTHARRPRPTGANSGQKPGQEK